MTYICQQPHKCTRCGHEQQYSPHDSCGHLVVDGEPLCPKCLSEFLRKNVGILKCSIDWSGDGSEYAKAKAAQAGGEE